MINKYIFKKMVCIGLITSSFSWSATGEENSITSLSDKKNVIFQENITEQKNITENISKYSKIGNKIYQGMNTIGFASSLLIIGVSLKGFIRYCNLPREERRTSGGSDEELYMFVSRITAVAMGLAVLKNMTQPNKPSAKFPIKEVAKNVGLIVLSSISTLANSILINLQWSDFNKFYKTSFTLTAFTSAAVAVKSSYDLVKVCYDWNKARKDKQKLSKAE